jgi:hypothetical protein
MQKIPGPTFLKLSSNAMKLSDQSLNHLFRKIYRLQSVFPAQIRDERYFSKKKKNAVNVVSPAISAFSHSELF